MKCLKAGRSSSRCSWKLCHPWMESIRCKLKSFCLQSRLNEENISFVLLFIFRQEINASEESDGISVISEGEMYKTTLSGNESENELDKATEAQTEDESYRPITPPLTPLTIRADAMKEFEQETFSEAHPTTNIFSSKPLMAGIAFVLLFSVLYSNFRSLKSELQSIYSRVETLEQENQILKTTLDELVKSIRSTEHFAIADEIIYPATVSADDTEERRKPPKTKSVWLGNEVEDKVKILDKKQQGSLPDYCYFTDENDLFYEYNTEICESKRRKLEAKNLHEKKDFKGKRKDDLKLDAAWKVEEKKSYDDFISDTLESLSDEIHEIKRKRGNQKPDNIADVNDLDEVSQTFVEKEEKPEKSKPSERRKKKKLQRQKGVGSAEWVDKRTSGREEARKKQEKQQPEINWFLKRKNERAAHRLESSGVDTNSEL